MRKIFLFLFFSWKILWASSYLDEALTINTRVICTHVCELHILHFFLFLSFEKKILWNKQAAAAHNKFAQYFSLSLYIFIFKNATSNNLLRHSSVIVSVHEYTWNYVMVVVCLRFFYVFVVVGWCHLKFFWYNFFASKASCRR